MPGTQNYPNSIHVFWCHSLIRFCYFVTARSTIGLHHTPNSSTKHKRLKWGKHAWCEQGAQGGEQPVLADKGVAAPEREHQHRCSKQEVRRLCTRTK